MGLLWLIPTMAFSAVFPSSLDAKDSNLSHGKSAKQANTESFAAPLVLACSLGTSWVARVGPALGSAEVVLVVTLVAVFGTSGVGTVDEVVRSVLNPVAFVLSPAASVSVVKPVTTLKVLSPNNSDRPALLSALVSRVRLVAAVLVVKSVNVELRR